MGKMIVGGVGSLGTDCIHRGAKCWKALFGGGVILFASTVAQRIDALTAGYRPAGVGVSRV